VHSKFQLLHSYVAYMVFLLLHEMLLTFVGGNPDLAPHLTFALLVCPNRTPRSMGVRSCMCRASIHALRSTLGGGRGADLRLLRMRGGPPPAKEETPRRQRESSCQKSGDQEVVEARR
jgi:hypothetical protein